MLGLFKNCNIIILSHKATICEAFEEIHQFLLDGISNNMALLVQYDKYDVINTRYYRTIGYNVVKFASEAYTLQEYITCDGKISTFFQYLICTKEKTNFFG